MAQYLFVLLSVILVLSVGPINGRKGFSGGGGRHSYPKSGGLSGGGHGYPSSGGSHGYPSSGGSHGYPSSGGSHGYPSSGGMSGGSHGYPPSSGGLSGGGHSYPSSGGLSGSGSRYPTNTHHTNNHGYPAGKGLSGNTGGQSSTNVHYHYNYNPPQQIKYAPVHGGPAVSYPVYRGTPPTYVYQYKDSGSKYGTLLAGLALLNLGTLAGGIYAASHNNNHGGSYKSQPGEICKFGMKKDNENYEETKIDCQLISSFIYQEQAQAQGGQSGTNTTVTTTMTNTTTVNASGGVPGAVSASVEPKYVMLSNGTLVPMNETSANVTSQGTPGNATASTVTVTTVTNTTTVVNALDVKGKPVEVTPGMKCYVIRNSPTSNMRKSVPCGLLQTYAQQSLKRNSATRNVPVLTMLTAVFAAIILY